MLDLLQEAVRPADQDDFRASVLRGLAATPKRLEAKYFYDDAGSALFEAICELDEYYVTRAEIAILAEAAPEIARAIGPGAVVFEPGSGAGVKCRLLLDALRHPAAFLPSDISADHLQAAADVLAADYPQLEVHALALDFTAEFSLPLDALGSGAGVVFFPGSTIGNFEPAEAEAFLARMRRATGAEWLLIGVDLEKDKRILIPAYDDAKGVTAAFNLNLLTRINRELGGNFDLSAFRHLARYDRARHRIEMHLESLCEQAVEVSGRRFRFAAGETVHTENSYKYTVARFRRLAAAAGWAPARVWTGEAGLFSLHLMRRRA
jgi:dimethylhistidine N-methyltransferase